MRFRHRARAVEAWAGVRIAVVSAKARRWRTVRFFRNKAFESQVARLSGKAGCPGVLLWVQAGAGGWQC